MNRLVSVSRRRFVLLSLGLGLLAGVASLPTRAEDQFEGAVWKFGMTSKTGKAKRRGAFRVNGRYLYQKKAEDDTDWTLKVGYKAAGKKGKTRLVFEGLGVNGGAFPAMNGRAVVEIDKAGEWSGRLVDSDGTHWTFRCSRVQE